MKLCPERVLGGSSPVVACFRHSMIVCTSTHFSCTSLYGLFLVSTMQLAYRPSNRHAGETHRFAGSVVPDNQCQGLVEFYNVSIVRAEAPNALDEHLH